MASATRPLGVNDERRAFHDEQNLKTTAVAEDGALQRRLHIGGFLTAQFSSASLSVLVVLLSFGALIFLWSRYGRMEIYHRSYANQTVFPMELRFQVIILVCRRLGLESCNLEEYQQGAFPGEGTVYCKQQHKLCGALHFERPGCLLSTSGISGLLSFHFESVLFATVCLV